MISPDVREQTRQALESICAARMRIEIEVAARRRV
jgi:hypothetical protein